MAGGDVNGAPTTVIKGHNLQRIFNGRDLQQLRVYMRTEAGG